ncbi:MAG: electron transfer flavoprotein subunit alpha/FixB family protein [Oscillospiraceae bacterium]|nr:electron transfer flavoprotein subunit alpha/FixB family protein [Oscillospiraceae bacterium]
MQKSDYKNMWVYIEHDGVTAAPVGLELCCELRKLCDRTGDKLFAVIINPLPEAEEKKIIDCGIDGIIAVRGTGYDFLNTDAYANAFTVLSRKYNPSAIFVGGTIFGRDFAPRFAVQLDTGCTSDAMELDWDPETGDIQFIEPAVGGKIMAVITVPELRPQVGTIRPGTFKYAPPGPRPVVERLEEEINFDPAAIRVRPLNFIPDDADPEMDIANADCVVCVGNGLKDSEHLERYRTLARLLGGKIGCTRPLYDRGILPYKLQIGQSGVMVKTKLYFSFGVSGAVNHTAGVDADVFVAVDKNPDAQIFNYCDYGIVGDMDEVCDELIAQLRAREKD